LFESKNKEEARKHIVHITYNNDSEGSGVIVPIEGKNYSYVLTAKHTFGKDDNERGDNYHLVQKHNIKSQNITLNTASKETFIVDDIFILEENLELDFLIIKIKNNAYIDNLKPLDIYEDNFNYCLLYGYPDCTKEGHTNYEDFNCEYKPIESKNKLEIRILDYMSLKAKHGTVDYMSGISGAGIFVENVSKDRIFLAGIEIQGTKTIKQNLVCLDLEKISIEINNALINIGWEVLRVSGAEWKNKFGFDMSNLDFQKEIEEFKEKSSNKFIKAFKDEENFIDKFDEEVKSDLKKEEEKFEKIAEAYLYIGMNFHQLQLHKRATHYLNKAIEYGGNKNKSYLLDAKLKRDEEKTLAKKTEQEKELMLGFINALYKEIHEYRNELEINPTNESIKKKLIECYKDTIEKLNFFDNRNDEILKLHNESLALYSDFNKYDNIEEQILELKDMIQISQKFEGMKNQVNDYQKEIEQLNKQVKILSTMDKKLDVITNTIKKTNNQTLDNFLNKIYVSNKALVSKIQTMYHQNDRVNRTAKTTLNNSIENMNEKINNLLLEKPVLDSSNDMNNDLVENVKKIIEQSNYSFYKGIQGLFEKEHDSYNSKWLTMSIAFTKREHELHIENLESVYEAKINSLNKKIIDLEKDIDNLALDYQNSEINIIEKETEFIALQGKYNKFKEKVTNSTDTLTEVDKLKYEDEIEDLQKLVEQLNGKNKQIDELKESITLSSRTAKTLENLVNEDRTRLEAYLSEIELKYEEVDEKQKGVIEKKFDEVLKNIHSRLDSMEYEPLDKDDFDKIFGQLEQLDDKLDGFEEKYELKIHEMEKKIYKISLNIKNKRRYKEVIKHAKKFKDDLEEIKALVADIKYDPKITLRLLQSDLEKIELIMNEVRWSRFNAIYCKVRFVVLGAIVVVGSLFSDNSYLDWIDNLPF